MHVRTWSRLVLVLPALLGGCDEIFDLNPVVARDAAAPPDSVDAYIPLAGCSPMSLVQEEFDNPAGARWFPVIAAPVWTINGGALVIDMSSGSYGTIDTDRYFDLRDDSLTVEITDQNLGTGNAVQLRLYAASAGDAELSFRHEGTDLVVTRYDGGNAIEYLRTAYDPVAHRFLRFASSAGMMTLSTSPTSSDADFTPHVTFDGGPWIGLVRLSILLSRTNGQFQVSIPSVHGGTSSVGACPAIELRDDFQSGLLDQRWVRSASYGGALAFTGGAVEMSFTPDGATIANVYLSAATVYDMRDGSFTVEISDNVDVNTPQYLQLAIGTITGDRLMLRQKQGTLVALHGDTSVGSATFDATKHRWWRLRAAGGSFYFETSGDGASFKPLGMIDEPGGLEAVEPTLGIYGTATAPSTARIESFNIP